MRIAVSRKLRYSLCLLSLAAWIWCLVSFFATTTFLVGQGNERFAINDFARRHYCATAYWIAADLALRRAERPYDPEHYRPDANATLSGTLPAELGARFEIDAFPYLPPFLILPASLVTATRDIWNLRRVWFLLVSLSFVAAVALSLRTRSAGRRLGILACPLLLASFPLHLTLQVGNVQPLVLACAVLGACAFDAKRLALGGALCAFAILTKGWPAALLLPLAVLGMRRALLWTLAWILCYSGIALAWFGPNVFMHFFSFELAWILDGSAFPFMAHERSAAENLSIPGLPHKLEIFGLVQGPQALVNRPISVVYACLCALTLIVGALRWRACSVKNVKTIVLATLCLSQFQSPYLASSLGVLVPMWLLLTLVDNCKPRSRLVLGVLFVILIVEPPDRILGRTMWTLAQTIVTISTAMYALFPRFNAREAKPSSA